MYRRLFIHQSFLHGPQDKILKDIIMRDYTNNNSQQHQQQDKVGLIVGNYCHDVLIRNGVVVAETLGGAASFISTILDALSVTYHLVSKVGPDFEYTVNNSPIVVKNSKTTVFHAYFDSKVDGTGHSDRILKRVSACEPIRPDDLPEGRYDFGMAVGVGGEILPETLEKMVEICNVVFVDIQALIRVFDDEDGSVNLVGLKGSGFYHLLDRIRFIKASTEEALFMDVEEVRKWCCAVVTNGKEGCKVCWKDQESGIAPFVANQIDPTGAGDSFLGGMAAGLIQGLAVPDAALLGNLFGSLAVGYIGLPKFDSRLLQRVKDEIQRRRLHYSSCCNDLKFRKAEGHEQFHSSLSEAKHISTCSVQECQRDLSSSPPKVSEHGIISQCTGQHKSLIDSVYEEPIQTADSI